MPRSETRCTAMKSVGGWVACPAACVHQVLVITQCVLDVHTDETPHHSHIQVHMVNFPVMWQ